MIKFKPDKKLKIEISETEFYNNRANIDSYIRDKFRKLKPKEDTSYKNTKKYQTKINEFVEELKTNPTIWEVKFKYWLTNHNIKFEFQRKVICPDQTYIVDFYIPSLELVVEIDGNQHYTPEALKYDKLRTKKLIAAGFKNIYRLKNSQVDELNEDSFRLFMKTGKYYKYPSN